jgi:hypothetical protein
MIKLKYKDIPKIKKELINRQNGLCPICDRNLYKLKTRDRCLDHNHTTGRIRAVLCRSCNAIEGKAYKLFIRMGLRKAGIDYEHYLYALARYSDILETKYIHPKYKEKK